MKYSYYPGCTLKNKARDLDAYARASAEALGFEMEEIAGESRIVMGYYVAPDQRRQGIARRICSLLLDYGREEYAMEAVYLRIRKENQASMALAAKLGFEPWMPDPNVTDSDLLFRILPAWK